MTPREMYYGIAPFLTPRLHFTLISFWWDFLSTSIPGKILDPIFETKDRRARRLSTMMNCSSKKSFPSEYYSYLQQHLDTEDFLGTVCWMNDVLDHQLDVKDIFNFINIHIEEQDNYLQFLKEPAHECSNNQMFFIAAYRLTWLGFYSLYGNMSSLSLKKLRNDPTNQGKNMWHIYTQHLRTPSTSILHSCQMNQSVLPHAANGDKMNISGGWFAVANWTDEYICMNDRPIPSYDGSKILAMIPNGTILYVEQAPQYNGLHCSSGQWAHINYGEMDGYIPLNLMLQLKT